MLKGSNDESQGAVGETEALAVLREKNNVTLMSSDVVLAEKMTGKDPVAEVARSWPDLKVILVSGYAGAGSDFSKASSQALSSSPPP
jgi:DNA-binding NtrC family response regulator